jgi:hypothetical protein
MLTETRGSLRPTLDHARDLKRTINGPVRTPHTVAFDNRSNEVCLLIMDDIGKLGDDRNREPAGLKMGLPLSGITGQKHPIKRYRQCLGMHIASLRSGKP